MYLNWLEGIAFFWIMTYEGPDFRCIEAIVFNMDIDAVLKY